MNFNKGATFDKKKLGGGGEATSDKKNWGTGVGVGGGFTEAKTVCQTVSNEVNKYKNATIYTM